MPKIVDKEKKRKEIALSCKNLFIEKGMKGLTIAEAAKEANIGKGTIYEYFENKDDIIFEIVNILLEERDQKKSKLLENAQSTKEKIKVFFEFFYDEDNFGLRKLFKEFLSNSLSNPNETLICHKSQRDNRYYKWFLSIIQEGIEKKELKPGSEKLVKGLYTAGIGFFITASTSDVVEDLEKELNDYFDTLFDFLEV